MAKQSWLSKTASDIIKAATGGSSPFIASVASRFNLLSGGGMNRDFLNEYRNWPFACVQARSEEVGNIQLELYSNGELVENHEVLDLLNKPNPYMTKHDLIMAHQAFLDLEGNSFWYLARGNNGKGAVAEIYLLRPDRMSLVPSKTNPLAVEGYVFTQPDGARIPFKPEEILHFKNFNPNGYHPFPHRGIGIVEAAMWAINTDNQARDWNFNFFRNSAKPDGILTAPGDGSIDQDELTRIRAEWEATYQGSSNASKVAILGGGLTWTEISRSQKDMDFVNQRTFSRDEILALFRTPKSIIGITDDVNRANADAAIYVFALRTIKPLMQTLVDHLTEMLLPEYADGLVFDFKSPVSEDRKESIDEYTASIAGGWRSPNEVREIEGLAPVSGGDGLFMPINMVPIGMTEPVKSAPKPAAVKSKAKGAKAVAKTAKKRTKSIAEKAVDDLLKRKATKGALPGSEKTYTVPEGTVKGQITTTAKAAYIEIWKGNIHVQLEPLEKAVRKYFDTQEKEVLANVRHQMKRKTVEQLQAKAMTDFLFDEDNAVAAGVSFITPFIAQYIKTSGTNAGNLIGTTFNPETTVLQSFVANRAKYFAKSINDTTRESLLTSIKDGLDNGEALADIEQRVAGVYDIATGARTQLIARTEISAASNEGAKSAYQQAGVDQWEWAVVSPEDADCLENDGAVVKIGSEFPSGATQPPDPHPNCECTTIPVFND